MYKSIKVLISDDNRDFVEILNQYFEKQGPANRKPAQFHTSLRLGQEAWTSK